MRRSVLWVVIAAASVAAPLYGAEDGAKILDEAWTKAVEAGDTEAVVKLYAPDAVLYPPGEMEAKGHDAIRAVWGGMLSANTVKVRLYESAYRTSGSLSVGWGRFALILTPKAGGAPVTLEGRFSDIAAKKGGKWMYIVDHASAPLAPPSK